MTTRRKRTRIDAHFKAHLRIKGERLPVETENLSMSGMLAEADRSLEEHVSEFCELKIDLADDVRLHIEAEIVRVDGNVAALEFRGMDEETYAHLRNIVRLSSPDPDAIDREQAIPAFQEKDIKD
jgi:hypothetical protein